MKEIESIKKSVRETLAKSASITSFIIRGTIQYRETREKSRIFMNCSPQIRLCKYSRSLDQCCFNGNHSDMNKEGFA